MARPDRRQTHRRTDPIGDAITAVESTLATHTRAVEHLRTVYDGTRPPTDVILVRAGEDLRAILESAPAGAEVRCEPATYEGPLLLTKPVTLRSTIDFAGRAGVEAPVWLVSSAEDTVSVRGPDIELRAGIGIKNTNPDYQLLAVTRDASRTVIDQVTCLGDPLNGQHRGIRPEGAGVTIRRSYIDHIGLPGRETQGIGADSGRDILIDDCYVAGAAEAVMFGGGDVPSSDFIPTGISLTHSTLTKRREWYDMGWQIKNALELKNARQVYVGDCVLQYAGIAEGQSAYLIVLTPRNQDGGSPFACVEDVLIERCRCEYGGGCVSLMGSDYNYPSGMLRNVAIRNVLFDHIDPTGITRGSGNCVYIQRGPEHVTLEDVTIRGKNLNSDVYFGPDMPPPWFVLRNIVIPAAFTEPHENAPYHYKIDGGGQGEAAARAFCTFPDNPAQNIVIDRMGTADASGASGYPQARGRR